jgi:hypothetical protein
VEGGEGGGGREVGGREKLMLRIYYKAELVLQYAIMCGYSIEK